jgi:hypothetical protein
MRSALVNENGDLDQENRRYVCSITAEDSGELDDFIDPRSRYPVIATTSKLLTTGVDAQTVKLIVIDQEIGSMTEFKQIIGCGTRIREDQGKLAFTIMDCREATSDGSPTLLMPTCSMQPPTSRWAGRISSTTPTPRTVNRSVTSVLSPQAATSLHRRDRSPHTLRIGLSSSVSRWKAGAWPPGCTMT